MTSQIQLSSLLDNNRHNSTYITINRSKPKWTNGQKRCFDRIKAGIFINKNKILRIWTITSALDMIRPIQEVFDCSKTRIRNCTPYRLYKEGYISKNNLPYFFPDRNPFRKLKFEYLKVKTSEGNGVLHILFYGDYLPYNFLMDLIVYYSGTAWEMDIRKAGIKKSRKDKISLAYYCVNQYIAGQSKYERFSNSWNWCFRGFVTVYKEFLSCHKHLNYEKRNTLWLNFLESKGWIPPPVQVFIDKWDTDGSMIRTKNDYKGYSDLFLKS